MAADGGWKDEEPSGVRLIAGEEVLSPMTWLATEAFRLDLYASADRQVSGTDLAHTMLRAAERADGTLDAPTLVAAGLLEDASVLKRGRTFCLSRAGIASLYAPGPRKPADMPWTRWAGLVAWACASHHGVTAHQMYTAEAGAGVLARARLCATLLRAGWSVGAAKMALGLSESALRDGEARWTKYSLQRIEILRSRHVTAVACRGRLAS